MKVLHVTNMWPSPGFPDNGTYVKTLVEALSAQGVENEVLPIEAWRTRFAYVTGLGEFHRLLRASQFDIIHAQYTHCIFIAHTQRRVPVVSHFHGEFLDRDDPKDIFLARAAARLARHALAVDRESFQMIHSPHRALIPIGVDSKLFFPSDREEARKKIGLDAGRKYVLFPSNPARLEKGYGLFKSTMSRIAERGQAVEELSLVGHDHRTVPVIMNAADLLLLTSKVEASPTVIKEALLCNLPVVSVDTGDVSEMVEGVSRSAIGPPDPDQLAELAVAILSSGERSNGRRKQPQLSIGRTVEQVLRFYSEVIARP